MHIALFKHMKTRYFLAFCSLEEVYILLTVPDNVLFSANSDRKLLESGNSDQIRYYLGITTDRNYHLSELPLINVGNSNVGNSDVFDRNFHFLIVSYRNYHCFLAAHRHLLVANFSC